MNSLCTSWIRVSFSEGNMKGKGGQTGQNKGRKKIKPGAVVSDGTGEGSLSRRAAKRRQKKGKAKAVQQDTPVEVIDLTFDEASRASSPRGHAQHGQSNFTGTSGAGSSKSGAQQIFESIPPSILVGIDQTAIESSAQDHQSKPNALLGLEVFIDDQLVESGQSVDRQADESSARATEGDSTASSASSVQQPATPRAASPLLDSVPFIKDAPMELLLPENVSIDATNQAATESPLDDGDMEGLHFLGDETTKGVSRYFEPPAPETTEAEAAFLATADQSKICTNCKKPGHKRQNCPHTLCPVCGAVDSHERRDCPVSLVCFGCGQRGHRQANCPDPMTRNSKKRGCDRCGARDHPENSCPSLWRVYSYFSVQARTTLQAVKSESSGWQREAVGGDELDEWCYNCAGKGHLGDDCPESRVSGAKLYTPSAFSYAMQSRGPYFIPGPSGSKSMPRPTHKRWTDNDDEILPFASSAFEGANAGKRSRDKARQAMSSKEVEDEDGDDWFGGIGRGGAAGGGRGRFGTPRGGNRGRGGLPFGHSHLMRSDQRHRGGQNTNVANSIAFGRLSLPSGPNGQSSASSGGLIGKKHQGLPPSLPPKPKFSTPVQFSKRHPIGSSSRRHPSPAPAAGPGPGSGSGGHRDKKRKRDSGDRDWEMEWQNSGISGGSVVGWGRDLDKEERAVKKMKGKQGPTTSKQGQKSKAQSNGKVGKTGPNKTSGQKYTGGY
ncbi:hypothetical protein BD324DRAFT_627024 [Kockovaella imperatae]|uniref:CCHC-type domain-containing protein n=1 Tax=Kockovaella imperatae TaxID=4999 RepID=A0A1Y1UGU8_9TREE|nr:hypothetical protein BD324DRAFT_627024 [Kockovaella imperatae]ORX36747.1 hypothetical protein BD324DRAFT_627024 [Kockovaella imperatae]